MSLFRKKPVVVEAEQFVAYAQGQLSQPFYDAICRAGDAGPLVAGPHIHTLEGPHIVTHEDWIVKGIADEFYPVKPDIFAKTYEPAPEEEPGAAIEVCGNCGQNWRTRRWDKMVV